MRLVDSKLYIANIPALQVASRASSATRTDGLASQLRATSACARLLALMLAAFFVVASPVLLSTVHSTVSLAFQISLQAGHFGLIAFQIFGR